MHPTLLVMLLTAALAVFFCSIGFIAGRHRNPAKREYAHVLLTLCLLLVALNLFVGNAMYYVMGAGFPAGYLLARLVHRRASAKLVN